MRSAIDEYIVGSILLERNTFDDTKVGSFGNLVDFVGIPFIESIREIYINKVKFLTAKRVKEGRKVVGVVNPKTNRKILVKGKTYKDMYKTIKLKKIIYKGLSKYNTVDYEVKENCVYDGLKHIFPKIKIDKMDSYTYEDVLTILKNNNINGIARDICHEILDEVIVTKNITKKNTVDFKIMDEHMYILSEQYKDPNKNNVVKIDNINDINKYKNHTMVVDSADLFQNITDKIRETNILIDYSERSFISYKGNIIKYIPDHDKYKVILDSLKYKSSNIYNCIDKRLGLRGYLNDEDFKYFCNVKKIIYLTKTNKKNNIQYDLNSAYPSKIYNGEIMFPVPIISDTWKLYNGEIINDWYVYDVDIKNLDSEIYNSNTHTLFGAEIKQLVKDKVKIDIKKYFAASIVKKTIITPNEVDKDTMRQYIGWLRKRVNIISSCKEINNKIDKNILKLKYSDEVKINKYTESMPYIAKFSKSLIIKQTGILANMYIMSLVNLDCYLMDKEVKKLNPNIVLNTIKTDSLGYIYDRPIKSPENKIKAGVLGFFKIEKQNDEYNNIKNLALYEENQGVYIEPTIIINKTNILEISDVPNLLNNNKSFIISGRPGYGKTYNLVKHIIPQLVDSNKKYYVTSTTIENAEDLEKKMKDANIKSGVQTIQGLLNGLSMGDLDKKFKDISYIIIDEASQITQNIYKILEYVIKNNTTKLILIGDQNQCKGIDARSESWIKTEYIKRMCDNNFIILKKHENIRYDNELDELLTYIETTDDIHLIRKKVKKHIKTIKKIDNTVNIAYYNKTCDKVKEKEGKTCYTVHSYQGKTINDKFSIHDLSSMTKELVYTAISRGTSLKNITFCELPDKKDKEKKMINYKLIGDLADEIKKEFGEKTCGLFYEYVTSLKKENRGEKCDIDKDLQKYFKKELSKINKVVKFQIERT
jgi:CHASE3 domain sensor protein